MHFKCKGNMGQNPQASFATVLVHAKKIMNVADICNSHHWSLI